MRQSYCSVFGCKNKKRTLDISWYSFPKSDCREYRDQRRQQWINIVRIKRGNDWVPTSNSKICSAHFLNNKKSEDPRSPSYNPTIFSKIYHQIEVLVKAAINRYKFKLKKSQMNNMSAEDHRRQQDRNNSSSLSANNDSVFNSNLSSDFIIEPELNESKSYKDIGVQHDFLEEDGTSNLNIFM